MDLLKNKNSLGGGGRINYLDALKCLGILLVIEGHVWDLGMGIKTYDSLSGLMLYSVNMPIFFFVSGFLAYRAIRPSTSESLRRIWQKFVCLVIPALAFFVFRSLQTNDNPLGLFTDGSGGYWFTITLWECFLIYYLVVCLFPKGKIQDVVLIVASLVGVAFLSLVGEWGPRLLDLNRLSKYFQFFAMGVLAMKYSESYERIMHNDVLKALALIVFFAILFTINYDIWPGAVFHFMRDIILRYLGTYIVISWFVCHSDMFDRDTETNRVVMDIGKKSLAIYLLQYFFIPDFKAYTLWLVGMDGFTVHVISFVYTSIIVATCYVFISFLSNSSLIKKYILGQK